jgi:hypothetical protein
MAELPTPSALAQAESPEQFLHRLRREHIVGRAVTFIRLAANSLLVYFGGQPGDRQGVTLWLDPTWHLRGPDGVLAGSRQAQDDPDSQDPEAGFRAAAAGVDALAGRRALTLDVDDVTTDLRIAFEGGIELRTFVADPDDNHLWHVRENATGTSVRAKPGRLVIAPPAPRRTRSPGVSGEAPPPGAMGKVREDI